jgi:ADP-heptose:LPS heptosyltransferase
MNVKTMLQADAWLGTPICWGLTLVRKILGAKVPDCARPPGSILIVKLAEQGSTVLAYPALRRAVEIAGRENVYFVTLQENRFILDALNVLPPENVITIIAGNFLELLWNGWRTIRRLRLMKLDAAIDMEFFSRGTAALAFLSGARRRAGFHAFYGGGPYRGDLMTHRLIYNPHLHTSQTFLTLVEAVLRDPANLPTFNLVAPLPEGEPPPFQPAPEDLAAVKKQLPQVAGAVPPLILLNSNASDLLPLRRWPSGRYVELAKRLLVKYPDALVAFTGAPEELAAGRELARQVDSNRCISLAGQTTLRQLLTLFTLADVLVTNDSGPAHFATLTSVRVVTLFGPETPLLFAARTPGNQVIWAGIACSPCVNAYNNRQSPCRDNVCMQAITVEQVFAEVCLARDKKSQES